MKTAGFTRDANTLTASQVYSTAGRTPSLCLAYSRAVRGLIVGFLGPTSEASAATFAVTTALDEGDGSLDEAILQANAVIGFDEIVFSIPGSGPHRIRPVSPLPRISDPLIINGYSQEDATRNSLELGINARLRIEIDGSLSPADMVNLQDDSGGILANE